MSIFKTTKFILTSAAIAATLTVGAAATDIALSHKTIYVSVDGVSRPVTTVEKKVQAILQDAGIPFSSRDEITPALDQKVTATDTIKIRHAKEISVFDQGKTEKHWVTETTLDELLERSEYSRLEIPAQRFDERNSILPLAEVGTEVVVAADGKEITLPVTLPHNVRALLSQANINVGPIDQVITHRVNGKLTVSVKRVTRGTHRIVEEIPFKSEEKPSDQIIKGKRKVATPGKVGERTIVRYQQKVDGKAVVDTLVTDSVTKAPVTEVILVGTAEPEELSQKLRAAGKTTDAAGNQLPIPTYSGTDPRTLARPLVSAKGWGDDQYQCLLVLWERESNWNPNAQNPSSGAYGIPQSLPGNKMASAGADWQTNPVTQITWGLGYIQNRYGTPCGALGHSNRVGWY
ncbi:ubiquitin-like domain-containing protein [Gleimia sp. 6138-11-ORH1]|uniref:aggregation-promoting factor C-terminal-like domain-containing protein n=1 Tax=Gleimia sp. 6138-11-ORH1 TaxID=2973937 RepID=UPI00216A82F1|nr:ubiquitin-like domain-containing protein [Gleimia sp. 6138-11-ORH1]MCS4483944.1 ubiquitin-like domain-containing protein [Gleimia sp. 6138-11-ORH1]